MKPLGTVVYSFLITCLWLLGDIHLCSSLYSRTTFKAAVYEHAVVVPNDRRAVVSREEALQLMRQNLAVFSEQAAAAKGQNVSILVFPEDGVYGMGFTREAQEPYLEFIPDPAVEQWTPCDDPDRYPDTEVQYELSCMAQKSKLYIVANIGDRQPCDADTPNCPKDRHFQFNTDVAYDPTGKLVARYHKRHLFFEYQFDTPPAQVVSFNTPFGRWGMFTCFDILFYNPAVTSVQREGIANIAFPTAWMDALPLLASVEFHSAFARMFGVNFLAANIHRPAYRFHGSGIYTPTGQAAFYHNATLSSEPRLIVAELAVLDKPSPEGEARLNTTDVAGRRVECGQSSQATDSFVHTSDGNEDSVISQSFTQGPETNVPAQEKAFVSVLFYDLYNFVELEHSEGTLRVCNNRLCCQLTYSLTSDPGNPDLFAFGSFDGNHTVEGNYYLQICALVRCANQSRHSCGSPTNQSATLFHSLSMSGSFETEYVFPEVLLTTQSNHLRLAEAEEWRFERKGICSDQGFSYPLLAAGLFGRDYSRDKGHTAMSDDGDMGNGSGSPLRGHEKWLVGAVALFTFTFYVFILSQPQSYTQAQASAARESLNPAQATKQGAPL